MKQFSIFLIIFGFVIIIAPEILAYMIGGLFIFIGFSTLFLFKTKKNSSWENYVKFGNFKIFR